VLGGAVGVDDTEEIQGARPQLEGHTERQSDHARIKSEVEQLEADDPHDKADSLECVPEVEVAASRDEGQSCRERRAFVRSNHLGLIRP